MNTVQVFVVFAALFCSQVLCKECNNYDECVKDIKHSKLIAEDIFISEFNKTLQLRFALKDNVNNLLREASNGPNGCVVNVNNHVENILEACGTLEYTVDSDIAEEILSFPEEYLESSTEEERQKYCKAIVPVINDYCKINENNKKALEQCNIEEKFDELYRQPWLACVYSAQ
ncbi:PREDICTED: uncharacterized protein LOC108563335 [Nicrophorus vespilloides]|uniref:Uncharacterized protein LOC108563335 n=1 Tax=Nicrophorus vespilloides TaxID=110193 RepID=A0ABM1MSC3_NICVS|nr:PREDICTED: uncharacterized protein LOC108563335 [Nicrophorus vespilloides]